MSFNMKKSVLLFMTLMLVLLFVPFISANQPPKEVSCCQYFEEGFTELDNMCSEFELTKENCDVVLNKWRGTTSFMLFGGIFEIVLVLAVLVGIVWLIRKLIKSKKPKGKKTKSKKTKKK